MAKGMRIKKDDEVIVIGGKDVGKVGRVIRAEPKKNRVYVEGVNMAKHHKRAGQRKSPTSIGAADQGRGGLQDAGIIDWEEPIHVSNVMLVDPKDNKPTRLGMRRNKKGQRERFAKRSGTGV
jgi:large subunit ribosomal protein L24